VPNRLLRAATVSLTIVLSLVNTLTALADPPSPPPPTPGSGLRFIPPGSDEGPTWPRELRDSWTAAVSFAEHTNPDGLGYPWIDRSTGSVVVSVVTAAGRAAINDWIVRGADVASPKGAHIQRPAVPVQQRLVSYSFAQLERIMDDATRLRQAGVPDADAIWAVGPDYENNRIVITIDRRSERLLSALAARYGTQAIAIRVDPRRARAVPLRHADVSPFFGGAKINNPLGTQCSSGFAWLDATHYYMLTAGHCGPNGGSYSTPGQSLGTVPQPSSNYENWSTTTGTTFLTYFANDSTYRGDISLITISPGYNLGRIYRGTVNSETWGSVKEMWWGPPTAGDHFCTGGAFSGEVCEYVVSSGVGAIRGMVDDGNGVFHRGVTKAYKLGGGCPLNQGDSGGPVYTVRPDNGIAAKGIVAAFNFFDCNTIYFTDLDLVYWGVPGGLRVE
jgi:hypothetical protein